MNATARPVRPLRVLVVDDDHNCADSLATLLLLLGFDVRTFYNAPTALAGARAWRPDFIISDIEMHRMSGYRLAQQVRDDEAPAGTTLIAVTACPDERRSREAGFDHHLLKPIDPRGLPALLGGAASRLLKQDHRSAEADR